MSLKGLRNKAPRQRAGSSDLWAYCARVQWGSGEEAGRRGCTQTNRPLQGQIQIAFSLLAESQTRVLNQIGCTSVRPHRRRVGKAAFCGALPERPWREKGSDFDQDLHCRVQYRVTDGLWGGKCIYVNTRLGSSTWGLPCQRGNCVVNK